MMIEESGPGTTASEADAVTSPDRATTSWLPARVRRHTPSGQGSPSTVITAATGSRGLSNASKPSTAYAWVVPAVTVAVSGVRVIPASGPGITISTAVAASSPVVAVTL